MAKTIWASVVAVSWIDPRSGLPLVDTPPGDDIRRAFVTKNDEAYRFCNFMEVALRLDDKGRPDGFQFGPYSFLYTGISKYNIHSLRYPVLQHYERHGDTMLFKQTVGARTVTPEKIGRGVGLVGGIAGGAALAGPLGAIGGGFVGYKAGKHIAKRVMPLAPIWSEVVIEISADGSVKSQLKRHSLFPSITLYQQVEPFSGDVGVNFKQTDYGPQTHHYDGVPNMDLWEKEGWGKLVNGTGGPVEGNPWNVELGDDE